MAKAKAKETPKAPKSNEPMSNKAFLTMMGKKLGEETIFTFEGDNSVKVQPVSTGIPSLDYALGVGGLALGRVIEIYGPESSGKTTLSLKAVAEFQKNANTVGHALYGKKAVFVDAEHALDPFHAQALGVDISEETGMLVVQPDSGEQGYDIMVSLILSGQVGLIVGDSIPAFIPQTKINASAEDQHMAVEARLNGKMIPIIGMHAKKNDVLIIFINQIREKPGAYGNPETTPGGRTLKFTASQRLHVTRKVKKQGDDEIGQEMTVKVVKNKVAAPFKKTTFDYYFEGGVDEVKDIMNLAMDMDIIKRAGAWYYYGEDNKNPLKDAEGNELKWNGKDTVEAVLKNSPALYQYTNDIVQGYIPKDALFVEEDHSQDEEDKAEYEEEALELVVD